MEVLVHVSAHYATVRQTSTHSRTETLFLTAVKENHKSIAYYRLHSQNLMKIILK